MLNREEREARDWVGHGTIKHTEPVGGTEIVHGLEESI